MFFVISTRDELYFVPLYLSINRPWELVDVLRYALIYHRVALICARFFFYRISGCRQPCKISRIIIDMGSG
jgi:hypothetical protein